MPLTRHQKSCPSPWNIFGNPPHYVTSIQNLKGIFSPPSSCTREKKGFKKSFTFSALLSATQLNYFLPDLIYPHHFTRACTHCLLDDIVKLLLYSKIKVFKEISNSTNHVTRTLTKKDFSFSLPFTDSAPTECNAALKNNAHAVDQHI